MFGGEADADFADKRRVMCRWAVFSAPLFWQLSLSVFFIFFEDENIKGKNYG